MTARLTRRVRVLLAFLMVPVIVLGVQTSPAAAAVAAAATEPVYGAPKTVTLENQSAVDFPEMWSRCEVTAFYVAFSTHVRVDGRLACWGGRLSSYSMTPGYNNPDQMTHDTTFHATAPGSSHVYADSWQTTADHETIRNGVPQQGVDQLLPGDAEVFEVCVSMQAADFGNESVDYGCVPLNMGPPPTVVPDTGQCAYGHPVLASLYNVMGTGTTWGQHHSRMTKLEFAGAPAVGTAPGLAPGEVWKNWRYTSRVVGGGGMPGADIWRSGPTYISNNGERWTSDTTWSARDSPGAGNAQPNDTALREPFGIWIYAVDANTSSTHVPGMPRQVGNGPDHEYAPTADWGRNDPASCVFYIGPDFLTGDDPQAPGVPTDEPWVGLGETPPPPAPPVPPVLDPVAPPVSDDEACHFSWSDPASWLSGGMCAAVGLLSGIWSTLGEVAKTLLGLPAKIGRFILDGLGAILDGLFVPDSGFMNSQYRDIEDEWEQTTPWRFMDAITDMTPGTVSGCGGVPLNLNLPGGVAVSEQIGAACSGPMASTAAIIRTVLSALIVVSGAFACLRALGAGLGWNPGVGRAES
jgi:hypothetical protein